MSSRWFRISYSRNAFLRLLAEHELDLDRVSLSEGIRAMLRFCAEYRPQHGELDALEASWRPVERGFEFALVRRMQRHGHPEAPLSLVFTFAPRDDRTDSGSSPVASVDEIRSLAGYAAVQGSRPVARRLDQG